MTLHPRVTLAQSFSEPLRMSSLADLISAPPPIRDKVARANWRARMWREGQRAKRAQRRLEEAARRGEIDWAMLRDVPAECVILGTGPARQCQWIRDDGCFCNRPSVFGRSWCSEHLRRVFVAAEQT
jgi:hypothetical protein